METDAIITLVLVIGIVLNVFAIGLRSRLNDPMLLLRKPALGLRAMAAMYLAVPLFTLAVTRIFPLQRGVGAVLLGLAVSPMLPPWGKTGTRIGGHGDYVFGLQVLATSMSILVVPVMIQLVAWTFGMEVTFNPVRFSMVLLITVGLPLALGMAATKYFPDWSQRMAGGTERLGNVLLLLGVVGLLITSRSMILGAIGNGTLAVIVAFIGFSLLAGHWLGGPDPGNRGALATANASRHPGIALLLASGVFPDHGKIILGTVLLYLLANIALTIPYQRWRCRVMARGAGGDFS